MAHRGTLIMTDERGRELRVECDGGLDSYASSDGGLRVRGVVNVKGEALEEARDLLASARDGRPGMAHYSGEVFTADRRDTRLVNDMRVRVAGIDETGNVRIESDEPLDA